MRPIRKNYPQFHQEVNTAALVAVARGTSMKTVVKQLLKQCRIRTSTRNPLLRLFYFALNMLLRNLWIDFEREVVMSGKVKK
ncbi:MAG: hypothetical protein FWE67_12795 [Planctomycetaceae bacterium]|nr:hypothetical protein [Planctomycetaceae bacterium]